MGNNVRKPRSEVDLGVGVTTWLEDQGWTVYAEVQCGANGPRADIVAKRGNMLAVVELKQTLGLAVMEQADGWLHLAHLRYVAVPSRAPNRFRDAILRHFGIGLLKVGAEHRYDTKTCEVTETQWDVKETIRPRLDRHPGTLLARCLREEQRTFAPAGNAMSSFYSPFQNTCKNLREIVQREPGILLKDAIAAINHHYASVASAKTAIPKWIRKGSVKGVQVLVDGRKLKLYPDGFPIPPVTEPVPRAAEPAALWQT